ncbi:MAG TPA: rhodanese-like domain-containing protein, partial [Prolixibacteraceae bacterium]|nr:rhodanese-like domain-containing protein [Prolixibacteraceae bacterium]
LTIHDLADLDLAYSPPIGTANDAINMGAYTAENRMSGFSPSVTVAELDAFIKGKEPVFLDLRDVFAFEKNHVAGALHLPLELLKQQINSIPRNKPLIVYDETGKKGHMATRMLLGAGFHEVTNISGGYISLQRKARTTGFKFLKVDLLPVEIKSVEKPEAASGEIKAVPQTDMNAPLVIDVRTPQEFRSGAYPGAVNIPLDELGARMHELGSHSREIILYCASGARSAYGQRLLQQLGYTKVKNGGGIMQMMMRR